MGPGPKARCDQEDVTALNQYEKSQLGRARRPGVTWWTVFVYHGVESLSWAGPEGPV